MDWGESVEARRQEVKAAVLEALRRGENVLLVAPTGWGKTTLAAEVAMEVARRVGLGDRVYSVGELEVDSGNKDIIANVDAIAEVYPGDKYYIVKKLQEMGII